MLISYSDLPSISILIPVLKVDCRIFMQTIESISILDYPNNKLQVSILFDGFNPSNEFCKKHFNILKEKKISFNYLSTDNVVGISKARNLAFSNCNGEFIFILDADDILPANSLSVLAKRQLNNKADVVYGDHIKMNYSLDKIEFIKKKKEMHQLYIKWKNSEFNPLLYYSFLAPGVLINRELYSFIGGFNNNLYLGELIDFLLRLDENCHLNKIEHIDEIVYIYRNKSFGINTLFRNQVITTNESSILEACIRRQILRKKITHVGRIGLGYSTYYSHTDQYDQLVDLPYFWP